MDDRPLSVFPDPDPDGVHHATTLGGQDHSLLIHMQAGQTVGAVVAVIAARRLRRHQPAAHLTVKAISAGMCLLVAFFKYFPFIFPIHGDISS